MKRITILGIAMIATILCIVGMTGYSQEDIKMVQDGAFGKRMRPAVVFHHDSHNETAKIDDCTICHHVYRDGKKVDGESSEGMACSECHELKDKKNPIPLAIVYHNRCKGCHLEKKQGPVVCGGCHVKIAD